jgi:hypothetical protein
MSIVRPKLEYASCVWDPHTQKDKYSVERVQRKAARFCLRNYKPMESVTGMLKDLGWDTLEICRKKARLMYKMSHNLLDMNLEDHMIPHTEHGHAVVILLNSEARGSKKMFTNFRIS